MNQTESILIKLEVRDRILSHGIPADIKRGTNTEIAKYISELVADVIKEKVIKGRC